MKYLSKQGAWAFPIAALLFLSASALGQNSSQTYDSFDDCYATALKVDQEGQLRFLAVGEDDDNPTFGTFKLDDQGDVDLDLSSPQRGSVSSFSEVQGKRVLKVSQGKRLGVLKTDTIEHDFSISPPSPPNQQLSIYETGTIPKSVPNVSDNKKWAVHWVFNINRQAKTCSLDHITMGAPGSQDSTVAFDLNACIDLLNYQSKWWPDAQYCNLISADDSDTSFNAQGMSNDEYLRLESDNAVDEASHSTPAFRTMCKMYRNNTTAQKLMRTKEIAAGQLCSRTESPVLVNYTQKYSAAHPVAPVGGNGTSAPSSTSTATPAQ